jgi:hypothetical protein
MGKRHFNSERAVVTALRMGVTGRTVSPAGQCAVCSGLTSQLRRRDMVWAQLTMALPADLRISD